MGSGLAQTYDPKSASKKLGGGINSTSAASLQSCNYTVPSMDGRLIPAIPQHLALKFKPPTIAVVYTMKDPKSGRMKKYIHEIKIKFEPSSTVDRLCQEMIDKETTYLNPAFIAKQ
jgi:transposase-like protein